MKILEIVLLSLMAVACALSFFINPGGAYALFIATFILSVFYFAMAFAFFSHVRARAIRKNGFSGVPVITIVASVMTGIVASIVVNAILFKLLLMPGATEMLNIGLAAIVILIVIQTILFIRRRDEASKLSLSRLAMFFVVSLVLYLTPSLTILRARYRNHPRYVEAFVNFQTNKNPATLQALEVEYQRMILTAEEFERVYGDKSDGR